MIDLILKKLSPYEIVNLYVKPICIVPSKEGYTLTINKNGEIIRTKIVSDFSPIATIEAAYD